MLDGQTINDFESVLDKHARDFVWLPSLPGATKGLAIKLIDKDIFEYLVSSKQVNSMNKKSSTIRLAAGPNIARTSHSSQGLLLSNWIKVKKTPRMDNILFC
jgi:hypothetical protein